MLAPGDYLTSPVPPEPPRESGVRWTDPGRTPEPRTAPAATTEPVEPRSFLVTLLRALGAIHS